MAVGRGGGGGNGVATVSKSGLYLPDGFGQFTKAKLATKPVIALTGDSVGRGYYASNLDTTSWAGQLKTWLQTKLGDGGSGFKGAQDSAAFSTAASMPAAAITAYGANGNFWTVNSGTWVSFFGASGPGHNALQNQDDNGQISTAARGTTITIYTIGGNASWEYQIDGGAWVAGAIGAYLAKKEIVTGLSAGTHTVSIRRTAGQTATNKLFVTGVSGENASGCVVNNFSVYGAQAGYFSNLGGTDYFKDGSWSGGENYPADLVIYACNLNDASAAVATETYIKNVRGFLDSVMDGSGRTGATDIMLLINHFGKYDTTNKNGQLFAGALFDLAHTYGAACLNLWAGGRNSWNYWNTLGYWGNASSPGAAGSDSVHLSDAGHSAVFAAVQAPLITRLGIAA